MALITTIAVSINPATAVVTIQGVSVLTGKQVIIRMDISQIGRLIRDLMAVQVLEVKR